MTPENEKTAPGLISDVLAHVSTLVRKEVDLARTEISDSAHRAGAAIGMIVAAVVIALVSLNVLAAALVAGIADLGVDAGIAALGVGLVLALIGAVLASRGMNDLKLSSLAPSRTAASLKKDAQTLKENIHA